MPKKNNTAIPTVSKATLTALFRAAKKFDALAPWEYMNDSDLFAVHDALSNKVGYGCIMGSLGEVLALGVYRGDEGLKFHQRLQNEPDLQDNFMDVFAEQNCLMCEFVDRDEMEPEDLKAIKLVGESFRGEKSYPQFRSLIPGHPAWFINEEEAKFLTVSLECACDFAERAAAESDFLDQTPDDTFFTYLVKGEVEQLSFDTAWQKHEPKPKALSLAVTSADIDELRIKKVLKLKLVKDEAWEIDSFYLGGGTIEDRERPYFARAAMAADKKSHFLLGMEMVPYAESDRQSVQEVLLSSIEKHKHLPSKIFVKGSKPEIAEVIENLSTKLGIKFERRSRLEVISAIYDDLTDQMQGGFPG